MRIRTQQGRENLFNFLIEVYNITKDDYTKIGLNVMTSKHNIGRTSVSTLVENKIVLKKDNGKNSMYKWNSIRPNYKMVEKILDSNLEKSRKYAEQRKKIDNKSEPIAVTPKTKKVNQKVEVKQKSFSFFWGLIKLNY